MRSRQATRWVVLRFVIVAAVMTVTGLSRGAAAQAQQFYSLTPCRVVDTRSGYGGIVYASTLRTFTVKGTCSGAIPMEAKSVALNATVIGPTVDGYILVFPNTGGALPPVSNMNFTAGTPALANGVVVGLVSTTPDLAAVYGSATGAGTLHLVLDVTGYFK